MFTRTSPPFLAPRLFHWLVCGTLLAASACPAVADESKRGAAESKQENAWTPLFDGKSLDGWKSAEFGGEGEVRVKDGAIWLEFGSSMTGITFQKKFPRTSYELRLEAKRVDGIDFFCGLTFPVKDSYCSFIVGGWGGTVVGLSSIDGKDASENDTTKYIRFEKDRWYRIRVRVTDDAIQAWIDDKQVVDQDIRGRRISTRNEVDLSQPLGIATWETRAALRKIEYRSLPEEK